MTNPKNKVSISNFVNLETVTYSLILLKGRISNVVNPDTACRCQKDVIRIKLKNVNFHTSIVDLKFQTLVKLDEGKNDIEINYCCESTSLTLMFSPRVSKYSVVPLYIICEGHDGRFQSPTKYDNSIEGACTKISLGVQLLQSVLAEKLYEQQLGRKTFLVESKCHIFNSSLYYCDARKMSQEELWKYFGREIMRSSIGCDTKKYLGFLSCTKYCNEKYTSTLKSYDDFVKITEAYVAMGGGGLALFGNACLYTWPETIDEVIQKFENSSPINPKLFFDASLHRGTEGAAYSTTLGSVLHELCHTFDLGHAPTGIMGREFYNIYSVFYLTKGNNQSKGRTECFDSNIEFSEEEIIHQAEKQFTRVENKNLVVYDNSFLIRSSGVLLSFHKWFNSETSNKRTSSIVFYQKEKLVKATSGIRVVEIRKEEDEMVIQNWSFEGRIMKFSFCIPVKIEYRGNLIILIEDSLGNILKEVISSKICYNA